MEFIHYKGISVPRLGFGTWQLEGQEATDSVKYALGEGYRHVDTAQIYGNEAQVGKALYDSGLPREEIFLTTKIWRDNVSAGKLEASLNESLEKLQTEYVDLLLIHWPVSEVPFAETFGALKGVQEKGRARLIGVSNFTVSQLREVTGTLGVELATNQVEYHPYLSQEPVFGFLRAHGMFLTAYSPLGRKRIFDDSTIQEIARKRGRSPSQIILRWHIQQPGVVAIPKSATPANIRSNYHIFDFTLTDEEMDAISALSQHNQRFVDPDFAPEWDAAS